MVQVFSLAFDFDIGIYQYANDTSLGVHVGERP